jgi:hypothetical protein
MSIGIHIDAHDLSDERAFANALRCVANGAKSAVLFGECIEAQQLDARRTQIVGELRILSTQTRTIGEASGEPFPQLERHFDNGIERRHSGLEPGARLLHVAAAMVEHHDRDRYDREKKEARSERRTSADDRTTVGA